MMWWHDLDHTVQFQVQVHLMIETYLENVSSENALVPPILQTMVKLMAWENLGSQNRVYLTLAVHLLLETWWFLYLFVTPNHKLHVPHILWGLLWCHMGHRSGSTLAQVMACCLMAQSHYLSQSWLIIHMVLWHSPKDKAGNIQDISETLSSIWKLNMYNHRHISQKTMS